REAERLAHAVVDPLDRERRIEPDARLGHPLDERRDARRLGVDLVPIRLHARHGILVAVEALVVALRLFARRKKIGPYADVIETIDAAIDRLAPARVDADV